MRRILSAFLLLMLLACPALAEAPVLEMYPLFLRDCTTPEQAETFLLYPPEEGVSAVREGYIRLIAQHRAGDAAFRKEYWLGGEPGGDLDLTLQKNRYGHVYTFHAGNMCTRAAYSMALSYIGVDVTPGDMSALTGKRNLDPPYKLVSPLVGVELVQPRAYAFDTMVENYMTGEGYSPVYLYIRKPDGQDHALLVIGRLPEKSRYLVLDPSGMWLFGQQHRIYMVALNKTRVQIVNSTFREEYAGSQVLQVYQWRKVPQE